MIYMGTLQTVYFLFTLLPKKPHQKIHFRRSVYYFLQVNLSFTIRLHGRPADPGGQVRQGLGGPSGGRLLHRHTLGGPGGHGFFSFVQGASPD